MKTLTYSIPDELAGAVAEIDDLDQRICWFVKEQAALENWRREKHSSKARELAAAAMKRGAEVKADDDPDVIRERLLKRWEKISEEIAS